MHEKNTSCICLCKDTNFKANHNFTVLIADAIPGCICLCKDTNFKANHNIDGTSKTGSVVVYAYAKILILKQITTPSIYIAFSVPLYMPMQRY